MAKAQFHKNQRVYVRPVGTWATIERMVPQWVKDMDEPLRIHYDVGLGRDFAAKELETEEVATLSHLDRDGGGHVVRVANKWRAPTNANHPFGTHPWSTAVMKAAAGACRVANNHTGSRNLCKGDVAPPKFLGRCAACRLCAEQPETCRTMSWRSRTTDAIVTSIKGPPRSFPSVLNIETDYNFRTSLMISA